MQTRLLATNALVLVVFLTLTGFVLDRSFVASTVAAAEEQMRQVIYLLMGAAETEDGSVIFPELPEPRLLQPESGLYAAVSEFGGSKIWRSPSALTTAVAFAPGRVPLGEFVFEHDGASKRFLLTYAVIWEEADESTLLFQVAADQTPFLAAIRSFRQSMYIGLIVVTMLVLGAQVVATRWGLRPLRVMADEVRELEEGRRDSLSGTYPRELRGLADNLARFVAHEQRSRARYRNALDDLAHSLKTPLAVLRNGLGSARGHLPQKRSQPGSAGRPPPHEKPQLGSARGSPAVGEESASSPTQHSDQETTAPACDQIRPLQTTELQPKKPARRFEEKRESSPTAVLENQALLAEQLDRMEDAVNRQLSRVSVAGPFVVARPVDLGTVLTRLSRALQRAHSHRAIELDLDIPTQLIVRGDERDFMDLFGNILENAYKYTHRRIRVTGVVGECATVCIEDDGPGIAPEIRDRVIDRGMRADSVQPGQGIGLAVVAELTALYSGTLKIDSSQLGGARLEVVLC